MFNTLTRMYEGRSRKFKHDIRATQEVEQFLLKNVELIQLLKKVLTTIQSSQNIH